MAHAQWAVITVSNQSRTKTISVKDASRSWGKFHEASSKDKEVSDATINQIVLRPQTEASIYSCGRENASSGVEATISLYDGAYKICKIYWECPWGSPTNTVELRDYNAQTSDFMVVVGPYNKKDGALGHCTIVVSLKG